MIQTALTNRLYGVIGITRCSLEQGGSSMHWMPGQPFNHQDSRSQRINGKDSPLPTIAVSGNTRPQSLENSVYERYAPLRHSSCDPGSQCSHVQGKRICACLKALRPSHSGFLAPDRLYAAWKTARRSAIASMRAQAMMNNRFYNLSDARAQLANMIGDADTRMKVIEMHARRGTQ
jgi:hypothetical protein